MCAFDSVGGLVGAVCTSPLDVVKTRLQVRICTDALEKQDLIWSVCIVDVLSTRHRKGHKAHRLCMGTLYRDRKTTSVCKAM